MTREEVVERLAKKRRVETLVATICKGSSSNMQDLSQIIYVALLEYDEARLVELFENGQIDFFLVRVIKNQYFSNNSPFHRQIRKFGARSKPIVDGMCLQDEEKND